MKRLKAGTAGLMGIALLLLTAGLGRAQSKDYCYDHPHNDSHYCFCYHHPKECNRAYRSRYHDWDRRPDWTDDEYRRYQHDNSEDYHNHHWWD